MRVILLKTIDKLGKMGDVVTVKEGYARNFLLPKNAAKEATPASMRSLESLKKKQAEEDTKKLTEVKALADKISALSIIITAQSGEEDKLFGSVSSDDISQALAGQGINIDKKEITLEEPIKKLGDYRATVKLHSEVKVTLKVSVVKK